ncbi:MAG: hypothetical protein QNJ60_00245 [Xenococcaceae cyanobacterium MO_188.B19]|nr:hypothetical protein [Xenococcaceae cyanobacterium MO_188.B19]
MKNSKKESIIVRIDHYYTYLSTKYYVKTNYSLLELNNICAYLQLLRWEFPYFKTIDDCIGQDDVVEILSQFYGCKKIVRKKSISCEHEIDLYDNWHYFVAGKNNRQTLNREYAKPGIRLAIIERMLIQAKSYAWCDDAKKDVHQLEHMKTGNSIPKEWGLKNGDGDLYVRNINVGGEKDLLLI